MSYPFTIEPGSPLEEVRGWKPQDVARFSWRAASGLNSSKLADLSGIDGSCVQALLAERSVMGAVKTYRKVAEQDPEEFKNRLRPMVRLAAEREMERERPCPRFIMFCMYCFEFINKDPIEEAISALIRSLNRKRRAKRKLQARVSSKPKGQGRTSSLDPAVSSDLRANTHQARVSSSEAIDLRATKEEKFAERAHGTFRRTADKFASKIAADTLDPAGQAYFARKALALKSSTCMTPDFAAKVGRRRAVSAKHQISPLHSNLQKRPQGP